MSITLTTDFGLKDSFVGIMKGVIAGINPWAVTVDLTHEIAAQDVMAGALSLRYSFRYFPRGTIHVAVVDPGVGSARRPLMVACDGHYFIGPDNGLLSLAVADKHAASIIHLTNPAYHLRPIGNTFHGRDIFAPVAAYLSLGVPLTEFGDAAESFHQLAVPQPSRPRAGEIEGEIIYIDRFGNLCTNIEEHAVAGLPHGCLQITLGAIHIVGLASNYAAAQPEAFVAVINSWGLLEIAVYRGNAQRRSEAAIGDKVQLRTLS